MKHSLISLFNRLGLLELARLYHRSLQPDRSLILMYHRLREDGRQTEPFSVDVMGPTVELFEEQIRYLKEKCNVVPLERIVGSLKGEVALPPNALAITFDDGYKDTYTLAYPVLRKYEVPATVFLTTGFVGTNTLLWYDRISYILNQTHRQAVTLNGYRYPLGDYQERQNAAERIVGGLKRISEERKLALIDELEEFCKVDVKGRHFDLALSWSDVREMAQNGITFGAHSVTHPILTRIPKELAREEILNSKQDIERELQSPVSIFAYPNGEACDFDVHTKETLRGCGFEAACTTISGANQLSTDRFSLRRIHIGPEDTLPLFKAKLAGLLPIRSRFRR